MLVKTKNKNMKAGLDVRPSQHDEDHDVDAF